jgi:hypothetical protein
MPLKWEFFVDSKNVCFVKNGSLFDIHYSGCVSEPKISCLDPFHMVLKYEYIIDFNFLEQIVNTVAVNWTFFVDKESFLGCFLLYFIQHYFICRPSDSIVPEAQGAEPPPPSQVPSPLLSPRRQVEIIRTSKISTSFHWDSRTKSNLCPAVLLRRCELPL